MDPPSKPSRLLALAVGEHRAGRIAEAQALYLQVLALEPTNLEALRNTTFILLGTGQLEAAETLFDVATRAAERLPERATLRYGLGRVLEDMRQPELALVHYRRAAELQPARAEHHYRVAGALREVGQLEDAVAVYEAARARDPRAVEVLVDLAGTLRMLERNEEALAFYRKAIALRPDFSLAHNGLGTLLLSLFRLDEAIASLKRAAGLGLPAAHGNLANAHAEAGHLDEAIAGYRRAMAANPDDWISHSNLVFQLPFHRDYDAPSILAEARQWSRRHGAAKPRRGFIERDRSPSRRLRIGYVSPYFADHCQAFFVLPLLRNHDRTQVEIFCYSGGGKRDRVTDEHRALAHHFRDIARMSDGVAAEVVRKDEIDVLVDLTMHMAGHRLRLFAERPAPIQVTWLAYPGTTGLDCIDYRLTDPQLDPKGGDESVYSERSHRLPNTFWCYDPLVDPIEVGPPPFSARGSITFGSLNAFRKVSEPALDLWARVLHATPSSRLVLLVPVGDSRARVRRYLGRAGVPESRLVFVDRQPRRQYLETYRTIDIGLDTFPYNGHTTSLDALWMGVPVVSLVGRTAVGRAGLSQATNLGLQELVTATPDEYVEIAARLANDHARLMDLRRGLRERMERSPLMNAPLFARGVEAAYRTFWRTWCQQ
ncbi:MAG TPA: tetratricopeptide repeat protein [Polyangiaceae bacterium]|nr:tetratricopeptide repeat protein [Polyangiaceae bacterium]